MFVIGWEGDNSQPLSGLVFRVEADFVGAVVATLVGAVPVVPRHPHHVANLQLNLGKMGIRSRSLLLSTPSPLRGARECG